MKESISESIRFLWEYPYIAGFYGVWTAFARWLIGDRKGGMWALLSYVVSSVLVAVAMSLYLDDEHISSGKRLAYIIFASFIARDILGAIMIVARDLATDPLTTLTKLRKVFKGNAK